MSLPAWAGVSVPDWVRQATAQQLPTYPPETDAVVLLDEEVVTVSAPGEYTSHVRRAVRILRPDGRHYGEIYVYLGHGGKLNSIHAWTLDAQGHEYEVKDKEFTENTPYSFELYSDVRRIRGTAPAANPGSVVAMEYDVRRHDWHNQLTWFWEESVPVRESRIAVQLPAGWEFKFTATGSTQVQPGRIGDNKWEWVRRDLPAIEHESRMPAYLALSSRLELAYFPTSSSGGNFASWDGIARWYATLAADRRTTTPEISEKVRELTAGKTDFDSKVRALASFLQRDIRYVAIEIGIGGHQPHPAKDVFRYRYGDCKDKATLLSTMLHEAGIASDYVLIHTERGVVDPAAPSIFFDHAILAIELPDASRAKQYRAVATAKTGKQYLIFDPTDEYTPLGELRADLQQTYALLVTDSSGELIRTPLLPPEWNSMARNGHFKLAADGTLNGEVLETLDGDHALTERGYLLYATEQERTQRFERSLGTSLPGFSLQKFDIRQLPEIDKSLIFDFALSVPQYARMRGPLLLIRPRVLGNKSFAVDTKPRHNPVEFDGTSRETDVYEIEIPEGFVVDDIPDPVNADAGFASYSSKVEVVGSKIRYSREFVRRELRIGPERIAELRKFEGIIGADEAASVVLKKSQ
jgi:transglutaminase-like putative cysteine protease